MDHGSTQRKGRNLNRFLPEALLLLAIVWQAKLFPDDLPTTSDDLN
jgi:hypothetical protein